MSCRSSLPEGTISSAGTTAFELVRHAHHDHPDDILCGRMAGVALGHTGRQQLPWLAGRIGGGIDAVYSSPQPRCLETAAIFGPLPTSEAGLDEIDFGMWTGQPFAALNTMASWRAWNADRDTGQAPDGEAAAAAQARAVACVQSLRARHSGGRVVVVSHGDIIKSVICHYLGLKLQAYERIEVAQASVSTLLMREGAATLVGLNETAAR